MQFNKNPQTQEKFAEIVQRIYNAIFISFCKISLKRTNRPRKNSHLTKDLNIQDQKDLSTYYRKMEKVPLGPKRVKLSYNLDRKDDYGQKGKEEDKHYDFTKQVEKASNNENEKEKEKVKANNNKEKKKVKREQKKKRKKTKIKKKKIADPKQNKPPLKFILVYHGTNQGGDMELNKGCPNIESKNLLI